MFFQSLPSNVQKHPVAGRDLRLKHTAAVTGNSSRHRRVKLRWVVFGEDVLTM
jgi:hypothetical protein